MDERYAGSEIGTILRHDAKTNSYKLALIRAINDVVLAFPDIALSSGPVAVPLRVLAQFWLAYYWPFVDPNAPVWQAPRNRRRGGVAQDMVFRHALAALRAVWEEYWGIGSRASDGFVVMSEMRVARRREMLPAHVREAYERAIASIAYATQQPIRYAGPGQHTVFAKPVEYADVASRAVAVPGTERGDRCLVVPGRLWQQFHELSLWIEALCIHEWSLFTETVDPTGGAVVDRGDVYRLLTDRPDNRRPLSWERNQVDILLMEGHTFTCPWTGKVIRRGVRYDVDHLLPVAVYPTNEIWNLIPSDCWFNQHHKRARLPSEEALEKAYPAMVGTYGTYDGAPLLSRALHEDVGARFTRVRADRGNYPRQVADATVGFIRQVAASRNIARFEWGGGR